jgi:uncharacterized protein YdaT
MLEEMAPPPGITDRKPAERKATMPWNEERYPPAMGRLHPLVREKAIAIANALLAEGSDEGFAIRVAIARAKRWASRRGFDPELADSS